MDTGITDPALQEAILAVRQRADQEFVLEGNKPLQTVDPKDAEIARLQEELAIAWEKNAQLTGQVTGLRRVLASVLARFRKATTLTGRHNRYSQEIADMALTDPLTKLGNRRMADERFKGIHSQASRTGKSFSLLVIDIDHFKPFNDKYGHDVGDEVLKEVAEAMRGNSRANDVLCRYGGEEFVIITQHTEKQDAVACADKLRKAVAKVDTSKYGCEEPLYISVGVLNIDPKHNESRILGDKVKEADALLYYVKKNGRNNVCYLDDKGKPTLLIQRMDQVKMPKRSFSGAVSKALGRIAYHFHR